MWKLCVQEVDPTVEKLMWCRIDKDGIPEPPPGWLIVTRQGATVEQLRDHAREARNRKEEDVAESA